MDEQDIPKKVCTGRCGQEYDATTEHFSRNKQGKYGLNARCKACVNERAKEYYNRPEVRESRLAYSKDYYSRPENKERDRVNRGKPEMRARRRMNRSKPKIREHESAYAKNYRERPDVQKRIRERQRVYRDRPEIQEQFREYNRRPDVLKRKRDWNKVYYSRPGMEEHRRNLVKAYKNRPGVLERYRVHARNRHARKKAVQGSYTPEQIERQLKRQKHKCYYCQKRLKKTEGKYQYHIEHTFPLSRVAGTDIPANSIDYIVLSCPTCNLSKGDKFPWEFPEGGRLC